MLSHPFPTTSWTLVVAAGRNLTPEAHEALSDLCERYWHPVYSFLRRTGHDADRAQDLTQGYFAKLLEKAYVSEARQERGRFRTFLLASVKNFAANLHDRERTARRGGSQMHISMADAEGRLGSEAAGPATPEDLFARQWALIVIENAMTKLRADYAASEHLAQFEALRPHLNGDADRGSAQGAAELAGMSEGAWRVSLHRLRKRFQYAMRAEILQTVADEKDVDEELRFLLSAL